MQKKNISLATWIILWVVAALLDFIPLVGGFFSGLMGCIVKCCFVGIMTKRINELCGEDRMDNSVLAAVLFMLTPFSGIFLPIWVHFNEKRMRAKAYQYHITLSGFSWLAMLSWWLGDTIVKSIKMMVTATNAFSKIILALQDYIQYGDIEELLQILSKMSMQGGLWMSFLFKTLSLLILYAPLVLYIMHYNQMLDLKDTKIASAGPTPVFNTPEVKKHYIRVLSGSYAGAEIPLADNERIFIGKDSNQCHLILKNPTVSRKHCAVRFSEAENAYYVTDMSMNGTYLKGAGGERRLMESIEEKITVGSILVISKDGDQLQLI